MAASLLLQPRPFLPLRGQTSPLSRTARPVSVSLGSTPRPNFTIRASASAPPKLSDSTRTITSLVALSVSASVSIARILQSVVIPSVGAAVANNLLPSAQELEAIRSIGCNLAHATGPMFAAIGKAPAINTSLNTPLTLVAAGLAKWLEIYGGVVMVRVLLSWFPNIRGSASLCRP